MEKNRENREMLIFFLFLRIKYKSIYDLAQSGDAKRQQLLK